MSPAISGWLDGWLVDWELSVAAGAAPVLGRPHPVIQVVGRAFKGRMESVWLESAWMESAWMESAFASG